MMEGWRTESMGQHTSIDSDHSVRCGIDKLVKLTNPGYSILDVGCYHGHLYPKLRDIGIDYLGIDIFESFIMAATQNYVSAKFEVRDLFQIEDQYDIVFCSRVLMHMPKFGEAIKKLLGASKKYMIMIIPIGAPSVTVEISANGDKVYFRRFSLEEVAQALDGYSYYIETNKPYSTVVVTI